MGLRKLAVRPAESSAENFCEQVEIDMLLQVMRHSRQLRRAIDDAPYDYSAIHAISSRISDVLAVNPRHSLPIVQQAQALRTVISLSSGLGLSEIWSTLLSDTPTKLSTSDMLRLEKMACSIGKHDRFTGWSFLLDIDDASQVSELRQHAFDLMALGSLPTAHHDDGATPFTNQIDKLGTVRVSTPLASLLISYKPDRSWRKVRITSPKQASSVIRFHQSWWNSGS
jgi:hypothetical protein